MSGASRTADAAHSGASQRPRALVVEDDRSERDDLIELLRNEGFDTLSADRLVQARHLLKTNLPEIVLLDLGLPDGDGVDLLQELHDEPWVEVVPLAVEASVATAIEALRWGATDYLTKPVDRSRLVDLLSGVRARAERRNGEVRRLRQQRGRLGRFGSMVGSSPQMQRVYDLIGRVAPTDASVLLLGESGTGKELAAETIYRLSRRAEKAFLPINCTALSPELVESQLFGHERGSFTGADRRHRGYFEAASGGTVFLDEVSDMPIELQVKLLRVLESGTIQRVGGKREIEVDVRIIAATNRDPEEAVRQKRLREDLLYRLQVFPIEMPPLRKREGDVELLANYFVEDLNRRERSRKTLSLETLDRLLEWPWPGNVRELKNVLQRAFILADERIDTSCLPAPMTGRQSLSGSHLRIRIGTALDEARRLLTLATLDRFDGNKTRTAERLGISAKTLSKRLSEYARRNVPETRRPRTNVAS